MRILLSLCSFLVLLACHTPGPAVVAYPAQAERSGVLQYQAGPDFGNKIIPVHYFLPQGDSEGMAFQVVLHGASRDAGPYLAGWEDKARKYGVIVVAPEFSKEQFTIGDYSQGQFVDSLGKINPPALTLFALMDEIFEFAKSELRLGHKQYNLYGHSAGGQFVHRFLQFHGSPKVSKAIAANAGWYTFPDEAMAYPYGLGGLVEDGAQLRAKYYAQDMLVLLGTADTLRTNNLRVNAAADSQGLNRWERGHNYFAINQKKAAAANLTFNWRLAEVPDAGHQHQLMSAAAADILYGKKE